MCGLHGILTVKAERNADNFLGSGFVAGSLRGMDSSGIAVVDLTKDDYELHKLPINGTFFASERVALRLVREACRPKTLAMCHTRHATIGGVSIDTAHPFECYEGDDRVLVGAHNGTLTNWKSKKAATFYEVDSEWALNHILAEKFDAFEDFYGAYCFTWWDSADSGVFNIARNKERPMFVVMLKTGGMAYASEAGMLYWLCERHDVEMAGSVLELEHDYWYKFPVDDPSKYTRTPLPKSKTASPVPNYHGHSNRNTYKNEVEKVTALLEKVSARKDAQPVGLLPMPKSPLVSEEEYKAAKDLGLLNSRAEFAPMNLLNGVVDGLAEVLGADSEAEVRGWTGAELGDYDTWHCTVIGAVDDGASMKIILGTPSMRQKNKQLVH